MNTKIRFYLQWYVLFLLAIPASGCEREPTTSEGYHYEIYKDYGLPPAEIGDEVLVYFEIRTTDTLLFICPQKEGIPSILVNPSLNKTKKTGPVADILPLLGEGDSAVVRIPVEDDMRPALGLETADEIFYHVVVRKINKSGSEAFRKSQAQDFDQSGSTEKWANLPKLRAKLKESGKGLEELRELAKFIGHVSTDRPQLSKTDDGLTYYVIDPGQGKALKAGEQVEVHYLGCLSDGVVFAETYTNDLPFSFVYQQERVIKGWDLGLGLVRKGGKLLLAVPPELAYGQRGKEPYIASNETLYYYLEVIE